MTLSNLSTPQLLKSADSMLALALQKFDMAAVEQATDGALSDAPGVLALIAQAAATTAQAKLELERSSSFINARGILIAIEDIAGVYVNYNDPDPEKGEGVLIVARTPITRRDENGAEKVPTTKTYKFFGPAAMRLRAWFSSHEFFTRFVAFDAGDDFTPACIPE